MRSSTVAALVAAAAFSLSASGCDAQGSGQKSFDERVHAYLIAHPEVIEEAMAALQVRQDAQKSSLARAEIVKNRHALYNDPRDAVGGAPGGSVTLVEFFDYRCPFCKAAEPELTKLLSAHPEVRLVLKQFPILDVEDQSHISEDAARAAIGALPQGKYAPVHSALIAERHLDEAGIKRILEANGVDIAKDAAVAQSQATADYLSDTHKLARTLGVDGTPAFVVNDTLISGARIDLLEAALKAAGARH